MSGKLLLDNDAMIADFFDDTEMIGIVTTMPPYRLCWMLNEKFNLDFTREYEMDVCQEIAPDVQHFFPVYQYCIPLSGTRFLIYKLKHNNGVLLPELKQLDYLWMLQSPQYDADAAYFIQLLRDVPDVQHAQAIALDVLKKPAHLLV